MTDRTLFDPDLTVATTCLACGATRPPGADKAPGCDYDSGTLVGRAQRRPENCLNAHDPAHAPFPEGF